MVLIFFTVEALTPSLMAASFNSFRLKLQPSSVSFDRIKDSSFINFSRTSNALF